MAHDPDDPVLAQYRLLRRLAEEYVSTSNRLDITELQTDRYTALMNKRDLLGIRLDEAERDLCSVLGVERRVLLWHPIEPRRRRGSSSSLPPQMELI